MCETIKISPLKVEAEVITSIFGKTRGFMFRFKTKKSKLFVFEEEKPVRIHMFFVFFPLIIIWLDRQKNILEFKIARPSKFNESHKGKYILEVPLDWELFGRIKKGMKLSW